MAILLAGLVMDSHPATLGITARTIAATVMLFASSPAQALFNMTAVTMRQRQVPAALIGRVTSLNDTLGRGSEAPGGRASAAAAGIRATMPAGAIPIAAVAILFRWQQIPGRAAQPPRPSSVYPAE